MMVWYEDVDGNRLPFPVAFAFRRLSRARRTKSPVAELDSLLDFVEEALRFVNARLMADHLANGISFPPEAVKLLARKQTFGDRAQLAKHLATGMDTALAVLVSHSWAERHGGLGPALGVVVEHRNAVRHGTRPDERAARAHLVAISDALPVIAPLLIQITTERLYSVYRTQRSPASGPTLMPWNGPHAAEDEVTLDVALPSASPGACFAVSENGAVFLGPLFVARDEPLADDQDLWVYDHGLPGTGSEAGSIRWSNSRVQQVAVPSSLGLLDALLHQLSEALDSASEVRTANPAAALETHQFATTPALVSRLAATYVGRRDVDEWVDALVATGSGALWIEARAGAGKSSAMAHLCHTRDAVQHFVSATEGRSNVPAILRSLIAQIIEKGNLNASPAADDELLSQQLSNMLVSVAVQNQKPLLIVIDGLDELGSFQAVERFLSAFPNPLPQNTCLVVSSRPTPPTWRPGRDFARRTLEPLTIEMVETMAQRHGQVVTRETCEKAYAASRGNPLFCLWALRVLATSPDRDLDLRDNLEDYFGSVLGLAFEGEDSDTVQRMLCVLVAAGSHVDLPTLASATGSTRAGLLRSLETVRDLVVVSDGKLGLMHKLIADYLSDPTNIMSLEPAMITEAHRALARVALAPGTSYPGSTAAFHLLAAEALDVLAASIDNPSLVEGIPSALVKIADESASRALCLLHKLALISPSGRGAMLRRALVVLIEAGKVALVDEALELPETNHAMSTRDRAVVGLWKANAEGDYAEILATSGQLLANGDSSTDAEGWAAECYFLRANALRISGQHADALDAYEMSNKLLTDASPILKYSALFQIADLDYVYGRLGRARANLDELNCLTADQGLSTLRVRVLREIGHVELATERWEQAAGHYHEALQVAIVSQQANRIAECYISFAEALARTDAPRSLEMVSLGRDWSIRAHIRIEQGKSFYVEAETLLLVGDVAGALASARESLTILTDVGYGSGCARAQAVIAECLLRQQEPDAAAAYGREVILYYAREQIYPMHRVAGLDLGQQIGSALGNARMFDELDTVDAIANLAEFPQHSHNKSTQDALAQT